MSTPKDCPIGGTYYFDAGVLDPTANGWTVEAYLGNPSILSDGSKWIHLSNANNNGTNYIVRQLDAVPDYVEMIVALTDYAPTVGTGINASDGTLFSQLTGWANGSSLGTPLWSVGFSMHSQILSGSNITWKVYMDVYRNSSLVYRATLLDHEITTPDLPYSFSASSTVRAQQNGADLDFYVDGVLVHTITTYALTAWNGAQIAQYHPATAGTQYHAGSGSFFKAVKLAAGLPGTCLGTLPAASEVLRSSTAKLSHAGIYLEPGGLNIAQAMHNDFKDAVA